jgi:hypothetical protein
MGANQLNSFAVLFRMLYAPRQVATAAANGATWLPLGLLCTGGIAAEYPTLFKLGATKFLQMRLDDSPDGMSPASILIFLGLAIVAPVLLPLSSLAMGWLLEGYLRYVEGAWLKRAQALRITVFGFAPVAIQQLFAGAMKLALGARCDAFNPVATNVAFFFAPQKIPVFWYEAARGADVFSVWAVLLIALALAAITEAKPRKMVIPVAAVWICGILGRAWLLG